MTQPDDTLSTEQRHRRAALRVPAEARYLAVIGSVVQWFGKKAGLSKEQASEFEVAVDEACTNVISYAFDGQAQGEMQIEFEPTDRGLSVTIMDNGKPFDPEKGIELGKSKRAKDPASGGMGLMLISQLTDETHFQWDEDNGNQLTLTKCKERPSCP